MMIDKAFILNLHFKRLQKFRNADVSITCVSISIYKELSVQVCDSKGQAFNNAQRAANCHCVNVFL